MRIALLSLMFAASGACAMVFDAPLDQRLEQVSREFLGQPYRFSPLGEGAGPDPDPLLRLDAFDCTTYIETVMALATAPRAGDQHPVLQRIRYHRGRPGFERRRHLPASQWLPGLADLGLLHDITDDLGEARRVHLAISPRIWQERDWRILGDLPAGAVPQVEIALPYLPLDFALDRLPGISQVAVLSVVHEPHPRAPLLISHQALLIPGADGPKVRHARAGGDQQVVEEALSRFIKRLKSDRFWPVIGLNVADIRQPTWSRLGPTQ